MMARKSLWIFCFVNLAIVIFLVHNVWTLLSLLVVDGSDDAISRAELPGPNSELPKGKQVLIPRIIHQTYINSSIPGHWKEAQQSCLDLHEDYDYKVRNTQAQDWRGYGTDGANSYGQTSPRASLFLPSRSSPLLVLGGNAADTLSLKVSLVSRDL